MIMALMLIAFFAFLGTAWVSVIIWHANRKRFDIKN